MKWLEAIRELFYADDSEERPYSSDARFGISEVLESRLVLGSLSAETSLLPSGNANSAAVNSSVGDSSSPMDSSAGSQLQSVRGATSTALTNQLSSDTSTSNSSPATSDTAPSATTSNQASSNIGASLASISTIDAATAVTNSTSTADASVTPQTSKSTTQDTTQSAIATTSIPLAGVSSSTVQSPPVAIDNALTAVNRNVMVSSSVISGSGAVSAAAATTTAASGNSSLATLNDNVAIPAWFSGQSAVSTIRYDFRDQNGVTNSMTADQMASAEQVLNAWAQASGGKVQFVRDTQAAASDIVNIGVGDMSAVSSSTDTGTTLGTSIHSLTTDGSGNQTSVGTIWLNGSQIWSSTSDPNASSSSYDFQTVVAHEVGHVLGIEDDSSQTGIMNPTYSGAQDLSGISTAWENPTFFMTSSEDANGFITDNMLNPQLSASDVSTLLARAAVALPETNAIIAVVDRSGNILGVRVEQGVLDTIKDKATLAFAIDGAVAEARTAAFFSNDATAVTSRTVQDLSQTTILQREVEANPNSSDSTVQGPGMVAPIGIGGHFPAGIDNTPPVDLFNIEASNRDSTLPAAGTERFNISTSNVTAGQEMTTPISYGTTAGIAGDSQNRGIGTLPGGIPIYYDPNQNGVGATLVGGIGVFFPGADGYATHEQGFVAGQSQTEFQRMNTTQELEAEFMAFAAVGGSIEAARAGVSNAVVGDLGGIAALPNVGVLFENITLKGILLPVAGSTAGKKGIQDLINQFIGQAGTGTNSGQDQPLGGGALSVAGEAAPSGWLVNPHVSPDGSSSLTTADMNQIINAGIAAAQRVRATLRVQSNGDTGQQNVAMTFAISDKSGNILAMYRMPDSTVFSEDVAVAKARNVAYYNDPSQLQQVDQVATQTGSNQLVAAGTSFTSRTFRFLAEPRYPAGVDGSQPPQFSILNDAASAGIDPTTGENIGSPAAASAFTSVMGNDVFHVGTNFHDPVTAANTNNMNGIIFFPGSSSIYKDGKMVGGLGVSGDGVNQDDVVTYLAAQGYLPDTSTTPNAPPADDVGVDGVRLPYINFTRNPFG